MINIVLIFTLAVSTANPRPDQLWHYRFTVRAARGDVLIDRIDPRLRVLEMSPECSEAGNIVACRIAARKTTEITITVGIRRNACEPMLCRSFDWSITNYGYLAESGDRTDPVVVTINTSPVNHRAASFKLFLPFVSS